MLAFEKRTPTKAAQINRGREDPVVDFSTLVEALGWRALWHPEQRIYTYLRDGETEGEHLTFAALDRQAALLVRCCKAMEQVESAHSCSIQRASSSSPLFLVVYMLG